MLTQERRYDMLVGALEGGSNYWYYIGQEGDAIIEKHEQEGDCYVDSVMRAVYAGEEIPINDIENPDEVLGIFSLKKIEAGEALMQYKAGEHWQAIYNEDDDAITADVWFQYCTLGELVYG